MQISSMDEQYTLICTLVEISSMTLLYLKLLLLGMTGFTVRYVAGLNEPVRLAVKLPFSLIYDYDLELKLTKIVS